MVDLGFPRGGGANPAGVSTYDFAKFSQKRHEIERIWNPRDGGTRPKFYYVDPPLILQNSCLLASLAQFIFQLIYLKSLPGRRQYTLFGQFWKKMYEIDTILVPRSLLPADNLICIEIYDKALAMCAT